MGNKATKEEGTPDYGSMGLDELTPYMTQKQIVYCQEYIVDWNKTRAARVAGYSENTIGSIAYENSKKPQIKRYIELLLEDLEKAAGISKLRNLKELAKVAYTSIAHLHDSWISLKDFDVLTEEQKAAIESTESRTSKKDIGWEGEPIIEEVKEVKIKLHPKLAAIQEINKMMGYHAPTNQNVTLDGEIAYVGISPEEARDIKEKLQNDC